MFLQRREDVAVELLKHRNALLIEQPVSVVRIFLENKKYQKGEMKKGYAKYIVYQVAQLLEKRSGNTDTQKTNPEGIRRLETHIYESSME